MRPRSSTARTRAVIQAALASSLAVGGAYPVIAAGESRDEAQARYEQLLQQLAEVESQARELDRLIDRTEQLADDERRADARDERDVVASKRSDTAAAPETVSGPAPEPEPVRVEAVAERPPVVAADRREAAEAQAIPDLPRVSDNVGGVLTPRGTLVVEPSFQYSYSSVNRVAIEGFTILPALLVGIIDIAEADRETNVTSFTGRYGVTDRLELELKGSYVRRNDTTRSREFLTDAVEETSFNARGSGPGDYELGLRYQFQRRSPTSPYLVGNLRYKGTSGSDPFKISNQSLLTGNAQFSSTLPTGSGFRSLSPSLTMIYPTDPVVFFGSLGYLWTEKDDKGKWTDADGDTFGFGVVDPGDAWRLSLGLGLGLNDRVSMSISYQLDQFSKTWIETASEQSIAGSDATVGRLLFGYSMRMSGGTPLNLAFGIGATGDAPDTDLSFRIPFTLD